VIDKPSTRSGPRSRLSAGTLRGVNRFDNDDDWVGTPPEGHYTRDRAKPEFWWHQRPVSVAAAGIVLVVIVLIVVALLR